MATYNELSEVLAERAGRQLDTPFLKEMKVVVLYWYSRLRRDSLQEAKRDRPWFKQYTEVPLEVVPLSEWPGFPDIRISRTKCPLPAPLRANGILFDYVGSVDKTTSFGKVYSAMHELRGALDARYTGSKPKILYQNNYIYIFNELDMPAIGVDAIYDDPWAYHQFKCKCQETECRDDDTEFPGPRDLQQRIIQAALATELRVPGTTDTKTVEVNANNQAQESPRH